MFLYEDMKIHSVNTNCEGDNKLVCFAYLNTHSVKWHSFLLTFFEEICFLKRPLY